MSKFEQIGVDFQRFATTKRAAIRAFEYSCTRCCTTGKHIECDRCAIATAHSRKLADFN